MSPVRNKFRLQRPDFGVRDFASVTPEQWLQLAKMQQERFWQYVTRGAGCWLWTGARTQEGYGKFGVTAPLGVLPKQKHFNAHRLCYLLEGGQLPAHLVLRHTCDVPLCVNPSHLLPGTQADNIRDRDERGHTQRGDTHSKAILTSLEVAEIRNKRGLGHSLRELAGEYHVNTGTVSNVVNRVTWRHI